MPFLKHKKKHRTNRRYQNLRDKGHKSNSQWSTGNGSSIITQCCIPYRVKPVNDALNSSLRVYSLVATVKSGLISVQQLINHRKEAALVI